MTPTENTQRLIATRPNYIYAKRFDNSLAKLLERYPEGVPDRIIAQVLVTTEEDVREMWDGIVRKLRKQMGVSVVL